MQLLLMLKNYFILNRLIRELRTEFNDFSLIEAFTQEKDKLVLQFVNNINSKFLIISTNQNEPYLLQRNEFHRAKKNTIEFFKEVLPAKLKDIKIAVDDRIIKFEFESNNLFFLIHGKNTNVLMLNNEKVILSFKKLDQDFEQKIIPELNEKMYSVDFSYPDMNKIKVDKNFTSELRRVYPNISKEIIAETNFRTNQDLNIEEFRNNLLLVIKEIKESNLAVFYEAVLNKIVLAPSSFHIFSYNEKQEFTSCVEAIHYYLVKKFQTEKLINIKRVISKELEQQLSRTSAKLNEIKFKINEPSKEEAYKNYGNLILANLYKIDKGMKQIELDDFYSNQKIKIKLDEKLNAKMNAEYYFDKAKNEKQSRIVLVGLFNNLSEKYKKLNLLKVKFKDSQELTQFNEIKKELNIKESTKSIYQQDIPNFRHYLIENKYHLFVGKDSKNNDLLTTKFAKQNDYWFHARSVSGSHVVLRVDNSKEVIPKSVLKKAASIAAFYSKAKSSKLAPVAYTLKKFVVKRKGMEPGSVNLLKEEVLLVEPGVPEGCEYVSD